LGALVPRLSLNIIRVGVDQFNSFHFNEINSAINFTRNVYSTVSITIDRVEHWDISTAAARGRDVIDSNSEAETLTDEWTVPNHNADVFFVPLYVGSTAGLSRVGGPCDKDAKGMDGSVVEILSGLTGSVLAHEVGHYLGLSHVTGDSTNLMFPSVPNGARLTSGQGSTMRSHCFIEA
jgi:hypothetical protein